jgi:hypothetical protein
MTDAEIITKFLSETDDALLERLGLELDVSIGAKKPSKSRLIKLASEWFESNLKIIQKLICDNADKWKALPNNRSDVELVIMVVSLMPATYSPIIALLVSILVVKRGIDSLCG